MSLIDSGAADILKAIISSTTPGMDSQTDAHRGVIILPVIQRRSQPICCPGWVSYLPPLIVKY